MGTAAGGGKGSRGRAANGDRPIGAGSGMTPKATCQTPPNPPTGGSLAQAPVRMPLMARRCRGIRGTGLSAGGQARATGALLRPNKTKRWSRPPVHRRFALALCSVSDVVRKAVEVSVACVIGHDDGKRGRRKKTLLLLWGGGASPPPPLSGGGGGRQKGAPSAGPLYKSSVCNPNPHLLVCLQRVAQGLGVLGIGFCVDLTFVLIPVHPRRCSVLGLKWLRNAPDGQSQRAPPPFPWKGGL